MPLSIVVHVKLHVFSWRPARLKWIVMSSGQPLNQHHQWTDIWQARVQMMIPWKMLLADPQHFAHPTSSGLPNSHLWSVHAPPVASHHQSVAICQSIKGILFPNLWTQYLRVTYNPTNNENLQFKIIWAGEEYGIYVHKQSSKQESSGTYLQITMVFCKQLLWSRNI